MEACTQMPFTYEAYRSLIALIRKHGYEFKGYHDHVTSNRPVIMRHDIDFDPGKALAMAELEADEQVRSTYFVLLRTGFYNPFEDRTVKRLQQIASLGHDIGLHFDETQYKKEDGGPTAIQLEADLLEDAIGLPIRCVSMHRTSKEALEEDWTIPGIANSYAQEFFKGFEYISDSRRRWRKPVTDIIQEERHQRIHILTHPFWYNEVELSIEESLGRFISMATGERMSLLDKNFADLERVIDAPSLLSARLASLQGAQYETERLALRPFCLRDAPDMFEYTSRSEVSKFLNWSAHMKEEEARAWITSKLLRSEPDDLLLGIELAQDRKLIGVVRAYKFNPAERSCEISYALNPDFQGRGFMAEALQGLIDICAKELRVKRGIACIDGDNVASMHVAGRLGMSQIENGDFIASIKGERRLQHTYALERSPR